MFDGRKGRIAGVSAAGRKPQPELQGEWSNPQFGHLISPNSTRLSFGPPTRTGKPANWLKEQGVCELSPNKIREY